MILCVDHCIGYGVGKQLMEKVHEYGMELGCEQATVSTMSFQALSFYEKLGYKVDFRDYISNPWFITINTTVNNSFQNDV